MNYLLGDSTESNLDFNYLAFVREVIDCAVVMAESEMALTEAVERRRVREKDTAAAIAAVDELGKRAAEVVLPFAKEQAATPAGRCGASIAAAIREAVERESNQARAALAVERDEIDKADQKLRGRAKDVLEKLLRTHDLPNAEKEIHVAWTASGVKATMRQTTGFGIEAVVALEIPASSVFGLDLRVDRIADGVEVHAVEAGGWLKKSDKLVPHKLGRYQIVRVSVGNEILVRLRSGPDANANGFDVKVHRKGDITIVPTGGIAKEITIDDRDRPGLRMLAEKLEAAVRALDTRAGLTAIEIDGKPFAEHGHPRVLAERLIVAIAPTVQKIARHSRSPGELVLRRMLGDSRREEIFVSTSELVQRFSGLPVAERELFAPLQLGGETAQVAAQLQAPSPAHPQAELKAAPTPPEARTVTVPMPDTRSQPSRTSPGFGNLDARLDARSGPRTTPPPPPGATRPPALSSDRPRADGVPLPASATSDSGASAKPSPDAWMSAKNAATASLNASTSGDSGAIAKEPKPPALIVDSPDSDG